MDSTTAPTRSNSLPPLPTGAALSIANLPPEMLAIVFSNKKFTLLQRIALRAVSSHWQEVIEGHVLKYTKELLLSNQKYDFNKSNRLPLKAELVSLFGRLFPALADLKVYFNSEDYQPVPRLLTAFSSTLTTLELGQSLPSNIDDQPWIINLATAINSLTALTSLELERQPNGSVLLHQLLPTLGRLQRFGYLHRKRNSSIGPENFWSSLTASQPLTRMIHLQMADVTTSDYTATVLDIVAIFPSLTSLDLGLYSRERQHIRLIDIFRSLSSLKHLSELVLGHLLYSPSQQYPLPSPTDQPLTQVKKLDLRFNNNISSELLFSLVVGWFPSLEKFSFHGHGHFQLTPITPLRILARLQQLKELNLGNTELKAELLITPTDRPLASLTFLWMFIAADYPAEQFCSSAIVGWFPCLQYVVLYFNRHLPLTTAMLRDFSHLEHLSHLYLIGMQFEPDQLHLPTSNDRPLVNVKELGLNISQKPTADGRYFCTALTAWFPGLQRLDIPRYPLEICLDTYNDVFTPSISMLSEFATLEHLTKLCLSQMKFTKEHFPLLTSTDRVPSNLKKFYVRFDDWSTNHDDECHIISVIAAWFPILEKLIVSFDDYCSSCQFHLTTDLLRQLGQLKHLCKLRLPLMLYEKKHLQVPSPTDRPLTCLKELKLNMAELPENFDSSYCCSTVAAWFPNLEKIIIGPQHISGDDPVLKDRLTAYQAAIEANRHYFGREVELCTAFDYY